MTGASKPKRPPAKFLVGPARPLAVSAIRRGCGEKERGGGGWASIDRQTECDSKVATTAAWIAYTALLSHQIHHKLYHVHSLLQILM